MKKIAVIGGGAAGLIAAISAARESSLSAQVSSPHDVQVTLFEKADRTGKSILATGNGRCNFSNADIRASVYQNSGFVQETYGVLPPHEVQGKLASAGLLWREDAEGRLYPVTNRAHSVLDVLRLGTREQEVREVCDREVISITPVEDQFSLTFSDETAATGSSSGKTEVFDKVIVACGGKFARSIIPPKQNFQETRPVLGPLKTDTTGIKGLNNIRVRCALELRGHYEVGELLFRDYGVSGIAVFNMSRFAQTGDTMFLDLLPSMNLRDLENFLEEQMDSHPQRDIGELCAGILHPLIVRAVAKKAGLETGMNAGKPFDRNDLSLFLSAVKSFPLVLEGVGDPRQCQVMRGGFAVEGVNPKTMESLVYPGLYIAGEALDVDGPCGGYNLHWAWTSGMLAGCEATKVCSRA